METRLVLLEPREVDRQLGFTSEQTPIPWCTTHDTKGDNTHLMFRRGQKICVISTGGPDHKWWKDE